MLLRSRSLRRVSVLSGLLALAALACAGGNYGGPHGVTEIYLEAGRYQDAAIEAEKELKRYPEDVTLRKLAARAHAGAGNLHRAIEQLDLALDLAPSDPEISVLLGELEQRRGNLSDAYVAFRRASQLDPDEVRAWSGLALSAEALGFEAEAQTAYARWAELEGEEPTP